MLTARDSTNVTGEDVIANVYRDGERIDFAHVHTLRTTTKNVPTYFFRVMWDGTRSFLEQRDLMHGQLLLSSSTRPSDLQVMHQVLVLGSFLEGTATIPGDDQPLAVVLQKAAILTVHGQEKISIHNCYIVEATGQFGHYRAWLDPALDFGVRKVVATKKTGDSYGNGTLPYGNSPYIVASCDIEIDNQDIEMIGGHPIVLQSMMHSTEHYQNGTYTSDEYSLTRSRFNISPDFTKNGAFVLSGIPDETPVRLLDQDPNDHFAYVWKKGQVVRDENSQAIHDINKMIDDEKNNTISN